MYYGQVGTGGVASTDQPGRASTTLRYPVGGPERRQVRRRRTKFTLGAEPRRSVAAATGRRPTPATPSSANSVDPNLKNDRTDEIILGFDREIGAGFAVGASYIWRQVQRLPVGTIVAGITSADWVATTFTPAGLRLPGR